MSRSRHTSRPTAVPLISKASFFLNGGMLAHSNLTCAGPGMRAHSPSQTNDELSSVAIAPELNSNVTSRASRRIAPLTSHLTGSACGSSRLNVEPVDATNSAI